MESELYSELILDLNKNPANFGELKEFDLKASGGNPHCGDEVQFTIRIRNNQIQEIRFNGKGCAVSRASESLLTELVKGKSIREAKSTKPQELFEVLGNVVQTRIKCALLGLHVLQNGLGEFDKNRGKKTIISGINI